VSAEAGIATVTIAGVEVVNGATYPVTIASGAYGTLAITGYDAATGIITYTYTETGGAQSHNAANDNIFDTYPVVVTDVNGVSNPVSADLVIYILDDEPAAFDDAAEVTEDQGNTPTSTIAGDVTSNDNGGADGLTPTVTWNVTPAQIAAIQVYGTLTLNPDGTWTFELDNTRPAVQALNNGDALPFTFNYTVTDADGDEDNANLLITMPVTTAYWKPAVRR